MSQLEHDAPEPSTSNVVLTTIGFLGVIGLFFLVVAVAYLPNQAAPADQMVIDQRWTNLEETNNAQSALVNADLQSMTAASLRLPLERAMRVTVNEVREAPNQDVAPVWAAERAEP